MEHFTGVIYVYYLVIECMQVLKVKNFFEKSPFFSIFLLGIKFEV